MAVFRVWIAIIVFVVVGLWGWSRAVLRWLEREWDEAPNFILFDFAYGLSSVLFYLLLTAIPPFRLSIGRCSTAPLRAAYTRGSCRTHPDGAINFGNW